MLANKLCDSYYRLLAPVPVPRLPSVGDVEGSRSHHWLPWPTFGCPTSVGRGSEPLPYVQCNFLHHGTIKGTFAHHSIAVFTTTFSAYFSELSTDEVRAPVLCARIFPAGELPLSPYSQRRTPIHTAMSTYTTTSAPSKAQKTSVMRVT
jgi:hypothetical protein